MKITRVVRSAIGVMAIGIAGSGAGCSDRNVQTDLEPEGPPVIKQVMLEARVEFATGSRTLTQLTYGSHPDINDDTSIEDYTAIDTGQPAAAALARSNRIRVVFDELLLGNNLEEIACSDGTFSRVPVGTTPDDIKKCSGDTLDECTGEHAVCVGTDGPIGILDVNQDGAIDDLRMIDGLFTVTCDGTEVFWDREQSYYQPAGNQLISAGPLGVASLGPALVIVPEHPTDELLTGMRTGSSCAIEFAPEVVDKDGIRPCAPPTEAVEDCNPGDTSGITWTVEALRISGQTPAPDAINVPLGNPNGSVLMQFNAAIDEGSIGGVTIADESGLIPACANPPVGQCAQVSRGTADLKLVTITVVGGFTANNLHTVIVPGGASGVTDVFGGPLPADVTFSFTTGSGTPTPDAGVDADLADASIDAP